MDALLANMQENAILYGAIAVCALPIVYVTRKYSVPTILYLVEFSIYACVMHIVAYLLVGVTRWFKENSSMKALNDEGVPLDAPEWGTPLIEFWETTAYDPIWVWKAEVVCLVIILLLMYRYRPMQIQRKGGRKTQAYAPGKPGSKPGAKPGAYKGAVRGKGAKGARGTRGR